MKHIWKTVKAEEYWLEIAAAVEGTGVLEDGKIAPIWDKRVVCKWDGCVDYRQFANGYSYDHKCGEDCNCCEVYIHICDLEEHIEVLKEVLAKARAHYGEDWNT